MVWSPLQWYMPHGRINAPRSLAALRTAFDIHYITAVLVVIPVNIPPPISHRRGACPHNVGGMYVACLEMTIRGGSTLGHRYEPVDKKQRRTAHMQPRHL